MIAECFYCIMISIGFAITYQMRGTNILLAGFGSGLGWAAYLLINHVVDSIVIGYFLATIVATIYSEIMAIMRKQPSTVFLIPSIIPFVPGGIVFRSMNAWFAGRQNDFITQGRYAITTAGAIAMGIIMGVSIMRIQRNLARKKLYRIGARNGR